MSARLSFTMDWAETLLAYLRRLDDDRQGKDYVLRELLSELCDRVTVARLKRLPAVELELRRPS